MHACKRTNKGPSGSAEACPTQTTTTPSGPRRLVAPALPALLVLARTHPLSILWRGSALTPQALPPLLPAATCVDVCACMYVCVYIYTFTRARTHTHTRTHTAAPAHACSRPAADTAMPGHSPPACGPAEPLSSTTSSPPPCCPQHPRHGRTRHLRGSEAPEAPPLFVFVFAAVRTLRTEAPRRIVPRLPRPSRPHQ